MLRAVVFVIIAAEALVSYWSLFFLSLETRSHSNGPIPFSFVKWWVELVTPRCSDYSPVSRKTGGCFPEAVTYAGLEKSPIWLSGTSRFSCWASKIFNLPCPMCKGGFRRAIWYNNHQLRQASTGPWAGNQKYVRAACPKDKLQFKLFWSPDMDVWSWILILISMDLGTKGF